MWSSNNVLLPAFSRPRIKPPFLLVKGVKIWLKIYTSRWYFNLLGYHHFSYFLLHPTLKIDSSGIWNYCVWFLFPLLFADSATFYGLSNKSDQKSRSPIILYLTDLVKILGFQFYCTSGQNSRSLILQHI